MKQYNILLKQLRILSLLSAVAMLFTACSEEFVRDAGQQSGAPGTPMGAIRMVGEFDDSQEIVINKDRNVEFVFQLTSPALDDISVELELGDQKFIDAYNDAKGLKDLTLNNGGLDRYWLLPETNFTLPERMTLTVAKGKMESTPLSVSLVYDDNLLLCEARDQNGELLPLLGNPWMLPIRIVQTTGTMNLMPSGDSFYCGIRPANRLECSAWKYPEEKEGKLFGIMFADCRWVNPVGLGNCQYEKIEYYKKKPTDTRLSNRVIFLANMCDVGCLRPAFISYDAATKQTMLKPDPDLMYVLTHQERYVDPLRDRHIKICVSVEVEAKSPVGLCNLDQEGRAALVWQIAEMVRKYRLDGVALNDKGANYSHAEAPAVDKRSYTLFLKTLREALGNDKLILVSYSADENSALYEAHDGLKAGDYIDYAWWGFSNTICNPYAAESEVKPIISLAPGNFCSLAAENIDTPEFQAMFQSDEKIEELLALYDTGGLQVCVWLGIVPHEQTFNELTLGVACQVFGSFQYREGAPRVEGFRSRGNYTALNINWHNGSGYYGGGLKDW